MINHLFAIFTTWTLFLGQTGHSFGKVFIGRSHRRRRGGAPAPSLGSYPGKSGTFPGKLENILVKLKLKTFF